MGEFAGTLQPFEESAHFIQLSQGVTVHPSKPLFMALLLPVSVADAATTPAAFRLGEVFLITSDRETSERTDDGSSSSSSTDRDAVIERVIADGDDGVTMEYDFPDEIPADQRTATWQLPAKVLRLKYGELRLLNAAELESRVDPWLKKAGWTRAICGRLIFTWNAFRIDCDPQSILPALAQYDIQPDDLRDGALYSDSKATAPVPLKRKMAVSGDVSFIAEMAIDPEKARRDRAEIDVGVAEISGKPKTLETALRDHAGEQISGTITVTFDLNTNSRVVRRTRLIKSEVKTTSGRIERRTVTETIERKPYVRAGVT